MAGNFKKSIVLSVLFTACSFVAVLYTSCKKKTTETVITACTGVQCYNGGTCIDGKCMCLPGYEGTNCEMLIADRYTGNWMMQETVTGSSNSSNIGTIKSYTLTIKKSTDSKVSILLDNFSGNSAYNNVVAYVAKKYDEPTQEYLADITTRFCFKAMQGVSGSSSIVIGGSGSVNTLSTILQGTYYLQYKQNSKLVTDTVTFTADHL